MAELHESVSVVSTNHFPAGRQFVFKAHASDPTFLCHKLKQLLLVDPHPNVAGRPVAVVTKKVNFGSKRGVCGFLLNYCPMGNLAQALRLGVPQKAYSVPGGLDEVLDMETRFKCSMQVASALVHIQASPAGYYSDIKLENIVLLATTGDWDAGE